LERQTSLGFFNSDPASSISVANMTVLDNPFLVLYVGIIVPFLFIFFIYSHLCFILEILDLSVLS
jgi:hypothetical protein